jgi:hypothetical protein
MKIRLSFNTAQELEKEAIVAFKEHWADVLRRARRGKPLGRKLWGCFEADTNARSRALAAEFFGVAHARKMCRLTPRQIGRRLSCYLPRAIEYGLEDLLNPEERRKFIRDIVTGIYVIFESAQCTWPEEYDEYFEGLWVATYPMDGVIDDWYERSIGGCFTCGTTLLMKSTGEDFAKREVDWLQRAIQLNLDSDGPQELYGFECEALTPSRIWVKIYIIEREQYVEGMMEEAAKLGGGRLRTFVEKAVEWLAREPAFQPVGRKAAAYVRDRDVPVPKAVKERLEQRLFGNVDRLSDGRIIEKLKKLLIARRIDDAVVREIESVLNHMLGQELRNYHWGVNF